MYICGQEGLLEGNEFEQYQYYIDHFLKDKQYLNDFFSLYPVLERRINEIIQNTIDIYKEVIERIDTDANEIMREFNIVESAFIVEHLSTDFSDSHKNGRRVFCVEFVSGEKILYKPRCLQNEIKLQEITNYFYKICNLGSYEYCMQNLTQEFFVVRVRFYAGHGGEDPGAVYKDRKEKDDNLKLTLAVGKILEENGVDVVYTRTTDIYQTPFEKAKAANEAGADFFISFHRNSSSKPEQYNGVEVLIYDKKGIKYQMAQNILGALGELGFRELGVKERPGLVVLRRTKMPALLIETGFINSEKDNHLFEKKFEEIARSIADAILGTLNEETVEEPLYYRVQTGAFRNRENADRMLYQLTDQGFPAFILRENDLYKVQVGAYMQLGNAVNMEQRLRDSGYSTVIVTK